MGHNSGMLLQTRVLVYCRENKDPGKVRGFLLYRESVADKVPSAMVTVGS